MSCRCRSSATRGCARPSARRTRPTRTSRGQPSYTDVKQGHLGDCYLLAGLAEVAWRNSSAIKDMFTENPDGTITVRFYHLVSYTNGSTTVTADYVTVDRYLPADSSNHFVYANCHQWYAGSAPLWVALAERA